MTTKGIDEVSAGNRYIVCQFTRTSGSFRLWFDRNPLNYTVPLVYLQLSVISLTSLLIDVCLAPLGQSVLVAQVVGGILLGPSFLSNEAILGSALFPVRCSMLLETLGDFGIMFFLFAIGVRADSRMIARPGRQAVIIGVSSLLVTTTLSLMIAEVFKKYVSMDDALAAALPYIVGPQCLTAFSNVSCLLIELNMVSSDLGRIATATALMTDVISVTLVIIASTLLQLSADPLSSALAFVFITVFLAMMLGIVRPSLGMLVRRIPTEKPLAEGYAFLCFISIQIFALITELVGQHFTLGPLLFGVLMPDGPPLGAPIISKLDLPVGKFLYPIFLTTSGLKTNIFEVDPWSLFIVAILVLMSSVIRVATVVLAGRFVNLCVQDSVVLGLVLNAKGVFELLIYNMAWNLEDITDKGFALSVIAVVGVTAIITPLIRYLYNPLESRAPIKRRTIQHSKRNDELRIMVCNENEDHVPLIIDLLEASNPTKISPIAVIAVLLEELGERATQMLVAHQSTRVLNPEKSKTSQIISALCRFELQHEECVSIQSFGVVSHIQTVHDDICRLARDQSATMIILPFHRRWGVDGSIGEDNKAFQNMNIKVMDRAPCSVGILVDRGFRNGWVSILNNQSIYRVAVIFISGPDDAESLWYAARMAGNSKVTLTIIRFLLHGHNSARERKQDEMLIAQVRHATVGNNNLTYQEQAVKDGVGLAASLRTLENEFDLVIVGKNHPESHILTNLRTWSECPELGVVGDMLSSPDFGITASVLVVQQQTLHRDRTMRPVVIDVNLAEEIVNSKTLN